MQCLYLIRHNTNSNTLSATFSNKCIFSVSNDDGVATKRQLPARCCRVGSRRPNGDSDSGMQQILSAATVTAVGLTCKAYLHSGLCSISVHGLPYLLDALYSSKRRNGQQGILTGEYPNKQIALQRAVAERPSTHVQKSLTISRRASISSPKLLHSKVKNHIFRLDDPLTWGILPARTYLDSHLTRWTLGASDIIFTNP